jgi:uncharacterized protein with PQ loop repeat
MILVMHHIQIKKRQKQTIDHIVGIASYIYPLTGAPQVISVFQGNIDGVSLISWACFAAFAGLFMTYGIIHKIKPMIVLNFLWLCIDLLIVVGILIQL